MGRSPHRLSKALNSKTALRLRRVTAGLPPSNRREHKKGCADNSVKAKKRTLCAYRLCCLPPVLTCERVRRKLQRDSRLSGNPEKTMFKERIIKGLSKRWRLRLKTGALALAFAAFSLLPWMHILTLGSSAGHGCRHQVSATSPFSHAPAIASGVVDESDTCWVCQSLVSLLQHNELTDSPVFAGLSLSSTYAARAPHAQVTVQIYPANRSQAPPVRA